MSGQEEDGRTLRGLIAFASGIVAPLSVLSALLFYFGYVSSRQLYDYFGLDVDTIGLSTQDYVMRSPAPLLTPLLVLSVLGVLISAAHSAVRRRLDDAQDDAQDADEPVQRSGRQRLKRARRAARGAALIGQGLVGAGIILVFAYGRIRGWAWYPLVTPLVLAAGAAITVFAHRVEARLGRHEKRAVAGTLTLAVVLGAALIWSTATVAQWSGRDSARELAQRLDSLPEVILDTKERLYLTSAARDESVLPVTEGQEFHYRYRRLRLLVQGPDHAFLVPDGWSATNSTLMIPLQDEGYRLQFRFRNDPPLR